MSIETTSKAINGYCYYLRDKIGMGSSSQVYRGIYKATAQDVAIKVISLTQGKGDSLLPVASSEIQILTRLKHIQNIIQIKSAIRTKNNIYIITQLCPDGTLEHFITKTKHCDEDVAARIIQQIIQGYKAIASKGFIHRDIKPSNIFKKGGIFKIGDFGYSIEEKACTGGPLEQNVGSPRYMPLQSLQQNLYNHKSDIWAIGLIYLELLSGKNPWKSKNQKQLIVQLKSFQAKNIIPKYIGNNSKYFLQRTLQRSVQKRMSLYELVNWNFNFNKTISNKESMISMITLTNPTSNDKLQSNPKRLNRHKISRTQIAMPTNISPPTTPTKYSQAETSKSFIQNNHQLSKNLSAKNLSIKKYILSHSQSKPQLPNKTVDFQIRKVDCPLLNRESLHQNIASQLQAQISYFRYLIKILKRLNQLFKTNDTKIFNFKCGLLFLIKLKMLQVKQLKFVKGTTNIQKKAFLKTNIYLGLENIISKYKQKYNNQSEKYGLRAVSLGEREFMKLLSYLMDLLYSNMEQLKIRKEELQKKKHIVFMLEELISFSSLYLLERQEHWLHFRQKSNINTLLLKSNPKQITMQYLYAVQTKFLQFGCS